MQKQEDEMNLVYNVEDRPRFGQTVVFAIQQLLAILAATIAVPAIIGNGMSQSAALFGAGVGTIVYLLFTKFKSRSSWDHPSHLSDLCLLLLQVVSACRWVTLE